MSSRVLAAVLLLLSQSAGFASAEMRLGASPMKLHLAMDPGSQRTSAIELRNSGDAAVLIRASVGEWTASPAGEMVFSPADRVPRSASGWTSLDLSEFTIPPLGVKTVRLTTSLPDSARGSYWAIAYFEGEPANRPAGLSLAAKARIGTTIYVTAQNTEMRDDAVTRMDVKPGSDPGSLSLEVSLANRGNVYYYPTGWIQVLGPLGEHLFEGKIPFRVLLPGTETGYAIPWRPTTSGELRFVATFDVGVESLIQGVKEFSVPDTLPATIVPAQALPSDPSDALAGRHRN